MLNCYFIRHGFAKHNEAYRKYGYSIYNDPKYEDAGLCQLGITQAKNTKSQLDNINFDYVFCSPLVRCIQTCCHLIDGKDIVLDDNLTELQSHICNKRKHIDDLIQYVDLNHKNNVFDFSSLKKNFEYNTDHQGKLSEFHEKLLSLKTNRPINILIVSHCDWMNKYFQYFHDKKIIASNCEIVQVCL